MKFLGINIGDIVVAKNDSNYRGKIVEIDFENNFLVHKCLRTGTLFECALFPFLLYFVKDTISSL